MIQCCNRRKPKLNSLYLYWITLSFLNCSSKTSSKDHLLLMQCHYGRKPKLTLFILDSSTSYISILSLKIAKYYLFWNASQSSGIESIAFWTSAFDKFIEESYGLIARVTRFVFVLDHTSLHGKRENV